MDSAPIILEQDFRNNEWSLIRLLDITDGISIDILIDIRKPKREEGGNPFGGLPPSSDCRPDCGRDARADRWEPYALPRAMSIPDRRGGR